MKKKAKPRIVPIILAFYALCALVLMLYGVLQTVVGQTFLDSFKMAVGIRIGFKLFIDYLIAIQTAAVMIAYSLFMRRSTDGSTAVARQPFYGVISGTLVALVFLAGVYTFLSLTVGAALQRGIDDKLDLSNFARGFLEKAKELEKGDRLGPALQQYNLYLTIDSENKYWLAHKTALKIKIADNRAPAEQSDPLAAKLETPKGEDAETLLIKAKAYMENEDYLSAYYYAGLAAELDDKNLLAQPLRQQIWQKIAIPGKSRSDAQAELLFKKKLNGYNALTNHDFVTAYYVFRELKETNPEDNEIAEFFDRSLKGLKESAFFYEEIERNLALPGISEVVFLNKNDAESREIVHIDRVIHSSEGWYFINVEIANFDENGSIQRHIKAPFGKLISKHISLNCRDRTDENKQQYLPVYVVGDEDEMGHTIPLGVPIRYLPYFNPGSESSARMGIGELWNIGVLYHRGGYDRHNPEIEILMRLLNPALFLILSLFAISFGWAYRARFPAKPPFFLYLLVPGLPFLLALLIALLQQAHRVMLGFVLVTAGFSAAMILLVVVEFALLVLALLLLAGQKSD